MDQSEIIELEAEEVSDEQLRLEEIIERFKPYLSRPIPNPGNKNMTWEEFEELYNEQYNQIDDE